MKTRHQNGFILPTVVLFSVVLVGSLVTILQYVSVINSNVQGGVSSSLAQQATDAGVSRAISCAETFNSNGESDPDAYNPNTTFSSHITPGTNCDGSNASGSRYIADSDGYQSQYRIAKATDSVADEVVRLTVTGQSDRITQLGALFPNSTYNRSARVDIPVEFDVSYSVEPGSASYFVTQVDAGVQHTCGVISQRAYCWGNGGSYRLGTGGLNDESVPARVKGAIENVDIRQVSTGSASSCAVTVSNQLWCWGSGSAYRLGNNSTSTQIFPVRVSVPGGAQRVSVGDDHACAINIHGKIYCWGDSDYNKLGVGSDTNCGILVCDAKTPMLVHDSTKGGNLPPDAVASQISASVDHTCAIAASPSTYGGRSQAYCWGSGATYRGGWPSTGRQTRPYRVPFATDVDVTRIAAGREHTCAIAVQRVYCWGGGADGELGDGARATRSFPTFVSALPAVSIDITASEFHTCSLSGNTVADTRLYCWGRNNWGQLANGGTATPYATPVLSQAGELGSQRLISVATDPFAGHTCGVSAQSMLYCWGWGGAGNIGDGSTSNQTRPKKVKLDNIDTDIGNVTDISAGDAHTCAVANNSSYCWGYNALGRTGTANGLDTSTWIPTKTNEASPSEIGGRSVTKTSAGYDHTCGIANNEVLCWGHNAEGSALASNNKLGRTGHRWRVWPMTVPGTVGATDVSAGRQHSCAVVSARAFCWGQGSKGRLGYGGTSSQSSPAAVQGAGFTGKTVVQVGAGSQFSCARTNEVRGVYCWGSNDSNQIGNSAYTASSYSTAIPVNTGPLGSRTVTDLSVGQHHACVVASGAVYCWGSNYYGKLARDSSVNSSSTMQQVALPTTATQVSAGYDHACATLSDNSVYCWGRNSENSSGSNGGRIGTGSLMPNQFNTPQRVVAGHAFLKVAAGYRHTCAITTDYKPYCWGLGALGRLGRNGTGSATAPVPVYTGNPPPDVIIETRTRRLDTENITVY